MLQNVTAATGAFLCPHLMHVYPLNFRVRRHEERSASSNYFFTKKNLHDYLTTKVIFFFDFFRVSTKKSEFLKIITSHKKFCAY